ncbi:MAG: GspE/PulE family protein [Alphaproteobacteria bacterium]|nr:GspE/PulE family protein [Alphaproteobacteria bacterium]
MKNTAKLQTLSPTKTPKAQDPAPTKMTSAQKIGDLLLGMKALSQDQLHIALHEQKTTKEMLGEILVRLGFIDQDVLAIGLAARAGIEPIDLSTTYFDTELLRQLPKESAAMALALPLSLDHHKLEIAMADPFDVIALDEIRRHFPRTLQIVPRVASRSAIEALIANLDNSFGSIDDILTHLETGFREPDAASYEHPVIQLVNHLLTDAVRRGASDIHLEPEDNFVRIRFRIDGTLRQIRALHQTHWAALSHRLKIMAGMNIADTRSIQDGRFQLQINGDDVDFRVAIMPSVWGETIVVRLLDHRKSLLPLAALGYSTTCEKKLTQIFEKPQGLIFVTGPTGSGKTTTLYSVLKKISAVDVHIATLEDPVEFQLDLIRQTAIQSSTGLDFAAGVRGLLRMDPDILFIGEVRDSDTAQMALRAAMTGHQVYSTLHCNDALGALPRLMDLGLNPRLLSGNLSGLIAQRLVRKLCPHCKTERRATNDEMSIFRQAGLIEEDSPQLIAEARGCPACEQTGRKGRTVIAEILPITPALDDLIAADAPRIHLLTQARIEGFFTMQEDGLTRVLYGDIAMSDLRRAVDLSRLTMTTPVRSSRTAA